MASKWIEHVLHVKKARGISFKDALKEANKTYKNSVHSTDNKKTKRNKKIKKHRITKRKGHKSAKKGAGKRCRPRR